MEDGQAEHLGLDETKTCTVKGEAFRHFVLVRQGSGWDLDHSGVPPRDKWYQGLIDSTRRGHVTSRNGKIL